MEHIVIDCNRKDIVSESNDDRNFRVILAPVNIAGALQDNVQYLKDNGVYARGFVYEQNFLSYQSDFCIPRTAFKSNSDFQCALRRVFEEFSDQYDIFHFYFGKSFLDNYEDLKILKEKKKKIIMGYMGDDGRLPSENRKFNPYYASVLDELNINDSNEKKVKEGMERCSEYIDYAIAGPENAYVSVSKYYKYTYINRTALDLEQYGMISNIKNNRPLIVHAPTNRMLKGTKYICAAIEKLKLNYQFDFKLIENISYTEAQKLYAQADLVIDQIILGDYGRLAVECMAMGKPVICYYNDYVAELSGLMDVPLINANPDTIEKVIENSLKNLDSLAVIGEQSRIFTEKYHDINKNGRNLIAIYNEMN